MNWSIYPCDFPGCINMADFQQDMLTTSEGYHKYWCEQHDPFKRKVPHMEQKIVTKYIQVPVVRVVTRHPGIYGKGPSDYR